MNPDATYSLSQQLEILGGSVAGILPELILTGTFVLAIILEISLGKRYKNLVPSTALVGILLSIAAVLWVWDSASTANGADGRGLFLGMIRPDGFGAYFKLIIGTAAVIVVLVSLQAKRLREGAKGMGEYYLILLAMIIGMYFMSMSLNLLMMYLAIELVSIPSYILTAYNRLSAKSAEASLKYVIYGAFSSGIMLYGISWLYGFTGTLDLQDPAFAEGLRMAGEWPVTFVLVLVLSGFAFKITALPFHFWSPDVYEGASYPVAAFFSIAPKAAGFALLLRFLDLLPLEPGAVVPWLRGNVQLILALMAIASMLVGNFAALRQTNFRRMLAYSGIGQTGYMLVGVLALNGQSYGAVMFYLTVYLCMNLVAFLVAGWMEENNGTGDIDDFKGLGTKLPVLAVILTISMISLTGLPPTAGFIGKWELFLAGWSEYLYQGNLPLLVAMITMLLTTVVSLFYYLRAPSLMVFSNPTIKNPAPLQGLTRVLLVVLTVPLIVMGIMFFDELINFLNLLPPNGLR
jgi:NADH-quinone oxidoreductase subunit N